jgi:hypothetical protein
MGNQGCARDRDRKNVILSGGSPFGYEWLTESEDPYQRNGNQTPHRPP